MGWDFIQGANQEEVIADRIQERGNKLLNHKVTDEGECGVVWTVWETPSGHRFIGCDVLAEDDGNWGYKDMIEEEHPYYYSCPLEFLDLAPEASKDWRVLVRQYHEE